MALRPARWWSGAIVVTGLLLIGSGVWHLTHLATPSTPLLHRAIDALLIMGSGLGFLYGGYRHATGSLPPRGYLRTLAWVVSSTMLFASLTVITLFVGSEEVTAPELAEAVHPSVSVGLLAGLLVGTIHAQAIANARAAARAAAQAEALQAEQDRMAHLNDLLRHYILNGVTVITGYAAKLRPVVPDDETGALDTIIDKAEGMATLIEHLRTIPDTDRPTPSAMALDSVIDASTSGLATGTVTVSPSAADLQVRANEIVIEGLTLLFAAVADTLDPGGSITITGDPMDETVTVTITAEPATLPKAVADSLFEPIHAGIGLKLYLAKQLLESDGGLRLAERTDEALRFEITLDAAEEGER